MGIKREMSRLEKKLSHNYLKAESEAGGARLQIRQKWFRKGMKRTSPVRCNQKCNHSHIFSYSLYALFTLS